jgi:hypothetical protein
VKRNQIAGWHESASPFFPSYRNPFLADLLNSLLLHSNLRRYALFFRVQSISPLHANESALHLLIGNAAPFLIPKKEKVFAIDFS